MFSSRKLRCDARTRNTKQQLEHHSPNSAARTPQPEQRSSNTTARTAQPEHHSPNSAARTPQPEHHSSNSAARTAQPEHHSPNSAARTAQPEHHSPNSAARTAQPKQRSPNTTARTAQPEHHSPNSAARTPKPEQRSPNSAARTAQPEQRSPNTTARTAHEQRSPNSAARTHKTTTYLSPHQMAMAMNAISKVVGNIVGPRDVGDAQPRPLRSETEMMLAVAPLITHQGNAIVKVNSASVSLLLSHADQATIARSSSSQGARRRTIPSSPKSLWTRVDLSVFGFSRLLGNYDGSKAQWVRLPFADVNYGHTPKFSKYCQHFVHGSIVRRQHQMSTGCGSKSITSPSRFCFTITVNGLSIHTG
jgi:hypothetical protein